MYIILDLFPTLEDTHVLTDEEGKALLFETNDEAEEYAKDVQNPLIMYIPTILTNEN